RAGDGPSKEKQQRQDHRSTGAAAQADPDAGAAVAPGRRVAAARARRVRHRPHPGVHRQGGGADLLQRGRARRGDAVEDVRAAALARVRRVGVDLATSLGDSKVRDLAARRGHAQGHDRGHGGLDSPRGGAALYVAEYARPRAREFLKPTVELLAGIPSVVLGFFALIVMATWFQNRLHLESRLNVLVSGVALSFAVIPVLFTLAEEALRAVPRSYVEAST